MKGRFMPYHRPKMFEFEKLKHTPAKGIGLDSGAVFAYTDLINVFKTCVPGKALKYSAFKETGDNGEHTFMLGWDHAIVIEKTFPCWSVTKIISGSYAPGNDETLVYGINARNIGAKVTNPAQTRKHNHNWAVYDFSDSPKKIEKLITFSITSCSFACLFEEDAEFLIVSHMAFAPPIPVAWIAHEFLGVRDTPKPLNLLASVNSTRGELSKFTTTAKFPLANTLNIDSYLVTRGPLGLQSPPLSLGENEVPFMTHPYTTLDFTEKTIYFGGALGSNNDNTRRFRELPPFHSILSKHYPTFMASNESSHIINALSELMQGKHGYRELHQRVIKKIKEAHQNNQRFSTARYKALKGQIEGRNPRVRIAPASKPDILAAFLLAVLSSNPDSRDYQWIRTATLAAWDEIQLGFQFDMDKLDKW